MKRKERKTKNIKPPAFQLHRFLVYVSGDTSLVSRKRDSKFDYLGKNRKIKGWIHHKAFKSLPILLCVYGVIYMIL